MGTVQLLDSTTGLVSLLWVDRKPQNYVHLRRHLTPWTEKDVTSMPAAKALIKYLQGDLQAFDTIRLHLLGTPFQQRVWQTLRTIPPGETWSYKQLAINLGHPTAFRAVANANGKNPIPLLIPCHRVIASDGSLGGFSSGLVRKQWLLAHETQALAKA